MNFKQAYSDITTEGKIMIFLSVVVILLMLFTIVSNLSENNDEFIRINLAKTQLASEHTVFLEKQRSNQLDEIEYLTGEDLKTKDYFILKFIETYKYKRFIVVILADPNNIMRFSNIPFNENLTDEFTINDLDMQEISNEKHIQIKIPSLENYYIYGEWHLNIYVYNENSELTAIISKPLVHQSSFKKNKINFEQLLAHPFYTMSIILLLVIFIYFLISRV
ncbi:MAG: hypothetical protein KAH86_04100 [Methanosarcinales archaeon]|nr:hypothetical protein [Methanosarcinales archaeon]